MGTIFPITNDTDCDVEIILGSNESYILSPGSNESYILSHFTFTGGTFGWISGTVANPTINLVISIPESGKKEKRIGPSGDIKISEVFRDEVELHGKPKTKLMQGMMVSVSVAEFCTLSFCILILSALVSIFYSKSNPISLGYLTNGVLAPLCII